MERGQLRGNYVAPGNGNFWGAAADNHNRQDDDFLAALSNLVLGPSHNTAASPYRFNATDPLQNHVNGNPTPSPYLLNLALLEPTFGLHYDQLGSEFSRLSLTPSAQPHLSIIDMGLCGQPQNNQDHNCTFYNLNVGAANLNRNTRRPRQHLSGVSGRIFSMAKDQKGCKYLRDKFIEEGRPEEIQMIFMEIKDHVCELMVHPSGNYLIQRFLEVCNQDQITQLLMLVTDDHLQFISICNDTHGTRAIQKLLQHLETSDQKYRVISVLRRITVALSQNINGSHIIHYCVKNFTVEQIEDILNIVADNCLDMATDQYGCVVLQTCLGEATGVPRDRLLADISSNALMLSENPYGNYVVQYAFGMNSEDIRDNIMGELCGNFVCLSMNKFGSHVVEKCLKRRKQRQIVMQEIIGSPYLLRLLQDRYGNYVMQVALEHSQGEELHNIMKNMIMMNSVNLHSHPYGQRVLKKAKGIKSRGTYDCASLTFPFI